MNADLPIANIENDKFGYAPFAEQLTPNLVLSPGSASLVVGVEAPWGAGKTSFLNLTRLLLQKTYPAAVILNYLPWLYSTVDSLLMGFCTQLAAQLTAKDVSKYQRIGDALMDLSTLVSPLAQISNHELIGMAASTSFKVTARILRGIGRKKSIDISTARTKVQEAITQSGKPIIVFVDDIDRLPPNEIRLLFQFLKAVVAFDGVTYVIAYDQKPIEQALSFEKTLDGREYLKKFVQLPIRLPRISNLLLQRYFRAEVTELKVAVSPRLSDEESEPLMECVNSAEVLRCLRTPRDVVRSFNVLEMRLRDCRGEVNLRELLLFVLLGLTCPEAVDLVRENATLFLSALALHPEFEALADAPSSPAFLQKRDELEKHKTKLFEQLPELSRELARALVEKLFENSSGSLSTDVRTAGSPHGLIKLLYGGGTPLSFSVAEVRNFLTDSNREQIVAQKQADNVLREWIIFISSMPQLVRVRNAVGLARALIDASKDVTESEFYSTHRLIGDYLMSLLGELPGDDRLPFLRFIAAQSGNLYIAEDVLRNLASEAGLWHEGRSFPIGERPPSGKWQNPIPIESIPDLEQLWLAQVRLAAAENTLHAQPHLGFVLHRWGQFSNDYSEPRQYVGRFCQNADPVLILRHFALSSGFDGVDKFIEDPGQVKLKLASYESDMEFRKLAIETMSNLERLGQNRQALAESQTRGSELAREPGSD